MMIINKQNSSISLTTVLIIGAMLLLSSIVLINSSLDLLSSTKAYSDHKIAQFNTDTCFEEAMIKIKANPSFTGEAQVAVNNGTCNYNIANYQGNSTQKAIYLIGSLNGTVFNSARLADLTQTPISVSHLN